MFCNKCGYQFDGSFCPKCGAKAKISPETPVNTTNLSEEKSENPYDVYYTEQSQNTQSQNTYEPQFGYQMPPQETGTAPQPPQHPYHQPYHPPYTNCPNCKDNSKSLKWWQILLIVLAAILGYGLISGVLPIACVGCAVLTCEETYLDDYSSANVSGIYHEGETAVSDSLSYTITNVEYLDEYVGITPARKDYKFLKIEVKSVNTSQHSEYISYDLSCYVGENMCNEIMPDNYYFSSGELMPGKNYTETRVFAIPEDADEINIYLDDYYNVINFVIE